MTKKRSAAKSDSPKLLPGSNKWWLILGLTAVALISVYVRIATATPIEAGGDAIFKWQVAHLILDGSDLNPFYSSHSSRHHFLRWAINLPTAALQGIFGYTVQTYYIAPILYATVASCLIVLLGRRARRFQYRVFQRLG